MRMTRLCSIGERLPKVSVPLFTVDEDNDNFLDSSKRDMCPYICYSIDIVSEEIFSEKCSLSEELSVKEIHIRRAVLCRTIPEEAPWRRNF
jgi:hypothetical protein